MGPVHGVAALAAVSCRVPHPILSPAQGLLLECLVGNRQRGVKKRVPAARRVEYQFDQFVSMTSSSCALGNPLDPIVTQPGREGDPLAGRGVGHLCFIFGDDGMALATHEKEFPILTLSLDKVNHAPNGVDHIGSLQVNAEASGELIQATCGGSHCSDRLE